MFWRLAVLKVISKPRFFVIFYMIYKDQVCVLVVIVLFSSLYQHRFRDYHGALFFKEVESKSSFVLPSLIISNCDDISQSLLVKTLIIVDICPTFLLCSKFEPDVVAKTAS